MEKLVASALKEAGEVTHTLIPPEGQTSKTFERVCELMQRLSDLAHELASSKRLLLQARTEPLIEECNWLLKILAGPQKKPCDSGRSTQ